tara:strand:- start:386 stop:550 length:165 start_codon:yes stop_codon:yes gene_type:complete
LAPPSTVSRFAGLLGKHQGEMSGGWGMLSGEEQIAVQNAMASDAQARGTSLITP